MSIGEMIDACVVDARRRIGDGYYEVFVYSWPQVWPECGSGRPEGQQISAGQTVVVIVDDIRPAFVYHCGRYAYRIEDPSGAFFEALYSHRMPGALETRAHLNTHEDRKKSR